RQAETIRSRAHNGQQLSGFKNRDISVLCDEIGRLAYGPDDIHCLFFSSRAYRPQLMMRTVQCRPDEIVHSGIDDQEFLCALTLLSENTSEKNAGVSDHDTAWFEHNRQPEIARRCGDSRTVCCW